MDEAERTYLAKLRDLAKKYAQGGGKDSTSKEKIEKVYQELKKQFSMGINVEKEHKSGNPRQIALDHLSEDPKYYSKLKKYGHLFSRDMKKLIIHRLKGL